MDTEKLLTDLYTVKEVAEMTGVSNQVVLNHIKRGNIKATKKGWNWFIPKDQVSVLKKHISE